MDRCFIGLLGFELQPGAQESATSDQVTTLVLTYKGADEQREGFISLWTKGTDDPLGKGLKFTGVRNITHGGGYASVGLQFQGKTTLATDIGSDTPEERIVRRGTTVLTVHLDIDGETARITYETPAYTVDYTKNNDPGTPSGANYTGLTVDGDKNKIRILDVFPATLAGTMEESTHYTVKREYLNFERSQVGLQDWNVHEEWVLILLPTDPPTNPGD